MHMVSGVGGKFGRPQDAFDLFAALFPRHMVGAPKVACRWKSSTNSNRFGGNCTAARWAYFGRLRRHGPGITIRTLVFRGDTYSYQAGAYRADSSPKAEYERSWPECRVRSALSRRGGGL